MGSGARGSDSGSSRYLGEDAGVRGQLCCCSWVAWTPGEVGCCAGDTLCPGDRTALHQDWLLPGNRPLEAEPTLEEEMILHVKAQSGWGRLGLASAGAQQGLLREATFRSPELTQRRGWTRQGPQSPQAEPGPSPEGPRGALSAAPSLRSGVSTHRGAGWGCSGTLALVVWEQNNKNNVLWRLSFGSQAKVSWGRALAGSFWADGAGGGDSSCLDLEAKVREEGWERAASSSPSAPSYAHDP